MKPGNLFIKVLNPAATKDEDSIDFNAHRIVGVRFFFVRPENILFRPHVFIFV